MTLEVRDLGITLGAARVVEGVSFSVAAGRTLGLVGESGAGKSLTSMSIPALLPPEAAVRGSIRLLGRELVGLSNAELLHVRGKQIGVVFQEPRQSFNPAFTVGEQIAETLRWHESLGRRAAHARAGEYPHQLSGGLRQRAMIATAIACRPSLLIADEPTSALDVTVQAQILKLLRTLQKSLGMAMLFVSHDLGTVAQMCDEVAVMYAGQIVEHRDALALYSRPLHPYTEGLLRSVPDPRARGAELYSIAGAMPLPGRHPAGCRFAPRCPYAIDPCHSAPDARCIRSAELALAGVLA